MYFLTAEESKFLLRSLIPKTREAGVVEELRGWHWYEPPLEPPFAIKIPIYEVAGKYCPTSRDLYLKKVENVEIVPGRAMIAGGIYHSVITQMFSEAKKLIYTCGPSDLDGIKEGLQLLLSDMTPANEQMESLSKEDYDYIAQNVKKLREFQYPRLVARISDTISKQPFIQADALAAMAIPIVCEYKLDGTFLGLSGFLSCDAVFAGGPIIFDAKFGQKQDFHKLSATGYALVMESLFEFPVDVGCTVYVDMRGNTPLITRDLFAIDDELRQWFIDERDDKMQIIYDEFDPGVAEDCPRYCSYMAFCR